MRKILQLLLIINCAIPGVLNAQSVKLINSTRQDWSGGVAGMHGSRYTFAIEFYDCKKEPVPDILWIGQDAVSLNENSSLNVKMSRKGDMVRFDINANIQKNDNSYGYYPKENKEEAQSPMKYRGVALLSYKYNKEQKYFVINRIMMTMEPIAYP